MIRWGSNLLRRLLPLALTVGVSVYGSGSAGAHIGTEPSQVEGGTAVTLSLRVPHGCADSPTTALTVAAPADVNDLQPVAKVGWTTSVAPDRVTFSGGTVPAEATETFQVSFTAPASTATGLLYVPVLQTCGKEEVGWIEIPTGLTEPEYPAPGITVVPATVEPEVTSSSTEVAETPPTSVEVSQTSPPPASLAQEAQERGTGVDQTEEDSAAVPLAVGGLVTGAAAIGGLFVALRRRRQHPQ